MDGRLPRPMEMDPNRFNQRLYRWMHSDAPWSVIPQNKGRPRVSDSGSQPQDQGYSYGYRESAPSEADTIPQGGVPPPSDSGYATQPHLDSVSLYSQPLDRNQDIQSLVGQMNDLGGFNIVQGVGSGLPPYSIGPHHSSENKGSFFCNFPGCKKPVCKTRSELNKHNARHNKPHKCDVPDCNRTEGFSTPNDLARHKQSVHNNDGVKYVCSEGQCQSKVKLWPRADNFRAHLDRMHHIKVAADDLAPYVYKEPLSLSSENMMHLNGLGATFPSTLPSRFSLSPISSDKSQDDGNNLDLGPETHYSNYDMSVLEGPGDDVYGSSGTTGLDTMPSNTSQDSPAQQLPEFVRPNMLSSPMIIDSSAHSSPARTSEHRVPQEQPSTEAIDLTSDDPMQDDSSDVPSTTMMEEDRSSPASSDCESPAHRGSSIKEPRGILASFMDDDLESTDLSEDHAVKLVKKLEESGILEKLGYKQTKQTSPITEPKPTVKKSTSNNSSEAQSSFSCPEPGCQKTFARNCELKKHLKRHDKPYGCTFGNCRKVFGSKNDWKRHENSQHFQLEVWKCDCRTSPTAEPCGKVSHRRETFRSHLQRDHKLQDVEIEKRLDSCRIGRNCEGAFWCGFCRKRVPLTKKGQMGWNERFDHIDAHFFGRTPNNRKMDISEWEAIDPDQKSLDEDGGESDSDTSVLPGSGRKRGHVDEPEAEELERQKRPRRHLKGRPFTLVTCCQCRSMQANLSLVKSCVEDNHRFCDNCPRETALSNEDIEAEGS